MFYRRLKSRAIDLDDFTDRLKALPEAAWGDIVEDVPPEWKNESVDRVEEHLRAVSAHASEFAEEVRRRLA